MLSWNLHCAMYSRVKTLILLPFIEWSAAASSTSITAQKLSKGSEISAKIPGIQTTGSVSLKYKRIFEDFQKKYKKNKMYVRTFYLHEPLNKN